MIKDTENLTTLNYYPNSDPRRRLFALWYFTILLIIWTILGHTVLGFEQAWVHPIAGVAAAIFVQLFLDSMTAWANRRRPRYLNGLGSLLSVLPPAIIPGLACAMLIYPNERVSPVLFAVAVSIASKVLFKAPVGGERSQHFFNPSNFGIVVTLLLFPWVGLAPAYHFTENVTGAWNWVLPGIVLASGIVIHSLFTGRLHLCVAWIVGFLLQAVLRGLFFSSSWIVPLMPMTSVAFMIFTLYMIPDPATTPLNARRQMAFGFAVAAVYGVLQLMHVVYGLFIALFLVSAARGVGLFIYATVNTVWVTNQSYPKHKAAASGD